MSSGGDSPGPSEPVVPEPQMTEEEFWAERNAKIALMEKQGEFLDKTILTLSGGALGLTLTFLNDRSSETTAVWWAIAGMVALVSASYLSCSA
jgi:hypothetical protein